MSNVNTVSSIIAANGGKFMTIVFVKKDGSLRKMNGRIGVKRYLKGGVNKNPQLHNTQIVMWDTTAKGYRTINMDTVTEIHAKGVVHVLAS